MSLVLCSPIYVLFGLFFRDDQARQVLVVVSAGADPAATVWKEAFAESSGAACSGVIQHASSRFERYVERAIRTLREECLDRITILNERHLRWVLNEFARYYNSRRPHRSLRLLTPESPGHYLREGKVARRRVLGGLVNDYYREAA